MHVTRGFPTLVAGTVLTGAVLTAAAQQRPAQPPIFRTATELVEIDAPESMVSGDLQARRQNTVQQFQAQGISIDQCRAATGQDV